MKTIFLSVFFVFVSVTMVTAQSGNSWIKKNYAAQGDWTIETKNGQHFLVLADNFKTKKGPDLKLFLTKKSSASIGKNEAVEAHGTFVANLKSHNGGQSYRIPSGVNLSDFKAIVIHCEKYTKVWAASAL